MSSAFKMANSQGVNNAKITCKKDADGTITECVQGDSAE